MKTKGTQGRIVVPITDFKYDSGKGIFQCYGNVKNYIDHARDRSVDGCFQNSIERHRQNGTMPKMLWMHNPYELPVGVYTHMEEDSKGLYYEGKLSKTTQGNDIRILAEDGALDQFSIGYNVIDEKWNSTYNCNDLIEVDILETSWVNFACNEESRLESIKTELRGGTLPTKRELQGLLREVGLSKRQSDRIIVKYNPDVEPVVDAWEMLAKEFTTSDF